jgi:hypothetical protein
LEQIHPSRANFAPPGFVAAAARRRKALTVNDIGIANF